MRRRGALALLRVVPAISVGFVVPNVAASARNPSSIGGSAPGDRVGADGRYELLARIGSGGMGAVWRALDHKLGCERAVKVLDPRYAGTAAFVKRFRGEATAASRVSHPNVVAVLDVAGEDERPMFLVMELLEGKTLSELVKGNGRLPWAQVQRYIDQIAAGLGAAHAQDVVHRDVKPGNCLVLPDGQVKILDFGIANVRDEARLTAAGEIIGTCSYMAPEQIKGQVDKRSDIYALGVLTFRLLTGRVPFAHRDQDKVLLAHLTEPPPVPSTLVAGLPPAVDDFVLRMLAKQPHKRFDGMEALRRVLAGIEHGAAVAIEGPTAAPPSKSATAMFEDAPTRARMGVPQAAAPEAGASAEPGVPVTSASPESVRARINTAPAGSGTLANLDASAVRLPGTVLLGEEAVGPSGGTQVMPPEPVPAGPPPGAGLGTPAGPVGVGVLAEPTVAVSPPSLALPSPAVGAAPAVPARGATVATPTPRPLDGLAASAGPARVTRIAAPRDRDGGSMVGGVVAALGGIALAVAVVVGWVFYSRSAETRTPAAVPAAVASDDEVDTPVEGEGEGEGEAEFEANPVEPEAPLPGVTPHAEARVAEGEHHGHAQGTAEGSTTPVEDGAGSSATPLAGEPTADAKGSKKRRKPRLEETSGELSRPEPKPEVRPDPDDKKKKPKDLRDPW
jgi:hypothetical protein